MSKRKEEPTAAEKAVDRFEESHTALLEFMEENEEFTNEFRRLVFAHNAALSEATSSMKNELKNSDRNKLIIGRFGVAKRRKEFWDGTELATLIPARVSEYFLTEKISYEVNVTKLEQIIRQGDVDRDEVYRAFHRDEPTLSLLPGAPKEIKL